jgi:hypothetical protein
MTAVSFCSVTVSADAPSALCRLTRSVRCAGLMPARIRCLKGHDEFSDVEDPFAEALHFGVTGPSVLRSGAADSEVAPQWLALVACCRLPSVASCCLRLPRAGCDFHPRPGDRVLPAGALRATSAKRGPRWSQTEHGVWRLIATRE